MMNKLKITYKFIFIFLLQLFFFGNAFTAQIKKFDISGNDRVSNETVIMFSNLKIGDSISQNLLNEALKNLFYTDYFKDVKISSSDGTVEIDVIENPIIQKISLLGIKKRNIREQLEEITSKIEKYPFVENKINDQVKLLKNLLRSFGYYFVELETSIELNSNNTVDLIYDFNLGNIAKIKKISFIGDKVFRDNTLRNIIISEENKFWKFITKNKLLDKNRINADVARLNDFYKNRGYYNSIIKSTTAVISNDDQFELIFNINAGKKYYFDKIIINDKDDIISQNLVKFEKQFLKLENKTYSKKIINNLVNDINDFALNNEFVFINAKYDEILKKDNKVDILVYFDDLEKKFVDRINILGNFITDEKVIRNNLVIDEGDPYNEILFNKSIQSIKAKNIFKSVKYKTLDEKNNKIINITVEEKATGEIFAGAGAGTAGTSFTAGIKENNYLGLGIKLDANASITDDSLKGKFTVINPNFNNTDKTIKTSFENSTDDFMTSSGYKTNKTGFSIGTEFEQMNNFFVNLELSNFYEDLETSSSANSIIKKQEGTYFENLLSYRITYNNLNQDFQPSDGYINKFSQTLPIITDDKSLENSFTSSIYHSVNDNLILSARLYLKSINSFEDNVRVSKRVFVPGRRLRGFESGKIGPKDGTQYIGGNYASSLNLNSTIPNIFFENDNIDVNFFVDLANVWEVDYNSAIDSNKLRSATGIAINWFSTIGPLTFSYAIPLSEADTDVTEKFRFQIGTSF